MKIETQKGISKSEWLHLTQWDERVFPEEGRNKAWSSVSWHSIAYSKEGDPIGHIGFDRFEILVDSTPCLVIGIGGVVVRPEYQGRAIPALLFKEVHDRGIKNLGAEIFALFCPLRLVPYYEKHSYQRHESAVYFLQKDEKVLSSFEFMHRGGLAADEVVNLQSEPW